MKIEDILAAFKTELLTEEQQAEVKQQIQDFVDLQVTDKLTEALKEEKERLITVYEEKFEDYKQDITSKFSDFVDTVLEKEMQIPENIMEYARKGELYSDLIEDFKLRLGIDENALSEESKELLKEAKDEIVKLREELNTAISEGIEAKADAKEFATEIYKRKKCDGLTEAQRENVMRLLEGVTDTKDIDRKFDVIVKHYLNEQGDDGDMNECVCPECGKTSTVKGACNMNECEDCEVKLKEKVAEAHAEVKTDKTNEVTTSPFDDYKKNVLKVLKENKF